MFVISTVNTKKFNPQYALKSGEGEIREFGTKEQALAEAEKITGRSKAYCECFIYEYNT